MSVATSLSPLAPPQVSSAVASRDLLAAIAGGTDRQSCRSCDGTGALACGRCDGTGEVECHRCLGTGQYPPLPGG